MPIVGIANAMHVRKCDVVGSILEACADFSGGGCGTVDIGLKVASIPGFFVGEVCCCTSAHCNGPEPPPTTPATTIDMSKAVFCYGCNDTNKACAGGKAFEPNHPQVGHDLCASGMCSVSMIGE